MIYSINKRGNNSDQINNFTSCKSEIDEFSAYLKSKLVAQDSKLQDKQNVQKFLLFVESKFYQINEEIQALNLQYEQLVDKLKSIKFHFKYVKSQQKESKKKLEEALTYLKCIKSLFSKNQLENLDKVLDNLKANQIRIFSKDIEPLNQIFEEPVAKFGQLIYENEYNFDLKGPQINFWNFQLSESQKEVVAFVQQFQYSDSIKSISHSNSVIAAQISPDEELIASIGLDNMLQIYSIEPKTKTRIIEYQAKGQLEAFCFSKDQEYIYLGENGYLSNFRMLDKSIFLEKRILTHQKNISYVQNIKDKIVLTSSIDGTIKIVDFFKNPKILKVITHNNREPRNFDYSQQYDFIVGSKQNRLIVWDLYSAILMENDQCYRDNGIIQVQLSPSNNIVLSACNKEKGIRMLKIDYQKRQFELVKTVFTEIQQIWNISWSNDDDHFVFCVRKFFFIVNTNNLTHKKVGQLNQTNQIMLTKQVPSLKYLYSIVNSQNDILLTTQEIKYFHQGYIAALRENIENIK